MTDITLHNADPDAAKIGDLYAQSRGSMVEAMRFAVACGMSLILKQQSLAHGQWLPWLRANADVLGFKDRTANLLMKAATDPQLTADLMGNVDDATALAISRKVWGNATSRPKAPQCEQAGDVSKVETRIDTKGREQPAPKPPKADQLKLDLAPPRVIKPPRKTEVSPPLVHSDDDGYEEWECCDLCGCDPPELTERQFRHELIEFLKRRAFYHKLDAWSVANAFTKLGEAIDLAAASYNIDPAHVTAIDFTWSYLNPPDGTYRGGFVKEADQSGVALCVIMYYDAMTSNRALLNEAIELQGGWEVWRTKVWRGRPTISNLEFGQAQSEAIAWLRTNHPERAREIERGEERATEPETKPPSLAEPPPEMVECPKCHGTGNMDDDGIPEFLRRQSS